jgi:hypothetical protein
MVQREATDSREGETRRDLPARPEQEVAAEGQTAKLTAHLIAAQRFRGPFFFVCGDAISAVYTLVSLSPLPFALTAVVLPKSLSSVRPTTRVLIPFQSPRSPANPTISGSLHCTLSAPAPRPPGSPGPAHVCMFLAARCRAIATTPRPCRICFPESCGASLIPRPWLSRAFRSSRHLTTHPFPRSSFLTIFKSTTTPFAPTRLRTGCRCFSQSSAVHSGIPVKMGSVLPFERKHKVTVVGSGNW